MKRHEVKCWPEFWNPLKTGTKTFELRRNDRDYQVGDELIERQWSPETHEYVGEERLQFRITYVMQGPIFGLRQGFAILGLGKLNGAAHNGAVSEAKILSTSFAAAHHICEPGTPGSMQHNARTIAQAIRDALQ